MKILAVSIFMVIKLAGSCYAQQSSAPFDKGLEKKQVLMVLTFNNQPPVKAFRLVTKEGKNNLFNGDNITDIKVIAKDSAAAMFGSDGLNGALLIKLSRDIFKKLIRTNDLLTKFKIADKDKSLPVYLDSSYCYHPDMYYYELKKIKTVRIDHTDPGTNFINIITIPSTEKLNTDIYIKGTYTMPNN